MARRRVDGAPRLETVDPRDLTEADASALAAGGRFDGLRVSGNASGADLTDVALDECVLARVVLDDASLDGLRLADSVLDGVTATASSGRRSTARDVRFEGCRIGAAEWFEAAWDRVLLTGCRIDYLGLADSTLTDVRLVDCTIGDLDLRGATAVRVAFERCRIASLSLTGATLQAFDLRGADLQRLDGVAGLRGATVSGEQLQLLAPLLAEASGITIA